MKGLRPALAVTALALAGCGSSAGTDHAASAVTAIRYSSAQQVVAALGHAGISCTGGGNLAPVVSGASSETQCDLSSDGSQTALIDVFPATVTNAMVTANSVSTGSQQIFSDVGPNWWIQTDQSYAQRIQQKLGGRIIAGPWNPPSAAASGASSADNSLSCSTVIDSTGWNNGPLTEVRAIAIASEVLVADGMNLSAGNASNSDLRLLDAMAFDMQNYSGSTLADDANQFASDENSYNPGQTDFGPEDTSYATAMEGDILTLVKDCPASAALRSQMAGRGG